LVEYICIIGGLWCFDAIDSAAGSTFRLQKAYFTMHRVSACILGDPAMTNL